MIECRFQIEDKNSCNKEPNNTEGESKLIDGNSHAQIIAWPDQIVIEHNAEQHPDQWDDNKGPEAI